MMARFLLLTLALVAALLLYNIHAVKGLDLKEATYSVKEAPFLGQNYKFALFEAQYDEELYLLRQQACGCVDEVKHPCPLGGGKVAPVVDENVVRPDGSRAPITALQENVWYNSSIANYEDNEYLKFTIPYNPLNPCPVITFELQTQVGSLAAYISARYIPTPIKYDFTRTYYSSSTATICPSALHAYYGTYYVLLSNQGGRASHVFSVKYYTSKAPTCLPPPTFDYRTLPEPDPRLYKPQTWLEDGVVVNFTTPNPIPDNLHVYYKLYAEGRCSFISVNLMKQDSLQGDPYLLVTPNLPNPIATNPFTVKWSSVKIPADDSINAYYCNPNLTATHNIFYIGIGLGVANPGSHQLVATTQQYTPSVPISTLAWTQFSQDLNFGTSPALTCPTAVHVCKFHSFNGCELTPAPCCSIFTNVPAAENPHSLFPWNPGDTSLPLLTYGIKWEEMQPIVPGKLAWTVRLEYTDVKGHRHVITDIDPSQCQVQLSGMFTNQAGEPLLEQPISFKPKQVECDYDQFLQIAAKIDELTLSYGDLKSNANDLALQQVRLIIESWKDVYQACSKRVSDFANLTRKYTEEPAYICTHNQYDDLIGWYMDPCCNPLMRDSHACPAKLVRRELPVSGTPNQQVIKDKCANAQCTSTTVQTWIQHTAHDEDPKSGCQAAFNTRASFTQAESLLQFTYDCKVGIEGEDLLGARCYSDVDCSYGKACNVTVGRCLHTTSDLLQCLVDSVPHDIAVNLLGMWGSNEKPEKDTLYAAFEAHWVKELCVGPRASGYRRGVHMIPLEPSCRDSCYESGAEAYCVELTKFRTPVCPAAPMCDHAQATWGGEGIAETCFSAFTPTFDDHVACKQFEICNWRRNSTYPCEQGHMDDPQCKANCLGEATADVCLDCSQGVHGTCLEIPSITTPERCMQGICTADASVTDPVECAKLGICTAHCPSCTTQTQCEAAGTCSDHAEFESLAALGKTGVCMHPRAWNGIGYGCPAGFGVGTWACTNLDPSFTQASCESITGAFWYNFATTELECTANAGYGCFSVSMHGFTSRSQSDCENVCSDCSWIPRYNWEQGLWTPGRIQELVWEPRRFYSPTSVARSVDYYTLTKDVEAAIARDFSYAYYTDSLCQYDSSNALAKSVICDCDVKGTGCFQSHVSSQIGAILACPYQDSFFLTSLVSVSVKSDTVLPSLGCKPIRIESTSVGKYQVPPDHSVTHALFKKVESNPYLIVVNSNDALVGQLISDAATLKFDFELAEPITVCIFVEEFIAIEKSATLLAVALQREDLAIEVYNRSIEISLKGATAQANNSRIQVCAIVDRPGTYFAVAVVPDYKTIRTKTDAQSIVAGVLYFCLLAFALVQSLLIVIDFKHQRLLGFKLIALAIIVINASIRIVYIFPPKDAFRKGTESVQFIIFELPTFLYFSVFTVIVYLWILVVLSTRHFGNRAALRPKKLIIRNAFVMANVFMYFIFVVFIYLIAILPSKTKPSPCFLGNLDSAMTKVEYNIKVGYWIFQLIVSLILCVGFLFASIMLLRIVYQLQQRDLGRKEKLKKKDHSTHIQMIIITTVAVVCLVFLLVRAIVLLNVAINSTPLHVIVFCLLEVVPQTMLVFYLHPFRCFREAGRKSTSSTSGSQSGSLALKTHSTAPSLDQEDF